MPRVSARTQEERQVWRPHKVGGGVVGAEEARVWWCGAYREQSADTVYEKGLAVRVDRARARFSAWYEMFPRSCTEAAERPGTLRECAKYVEYVAEMGFDVLYLPPINPTGGTERKGKNNSRTPAAR